MKPSIQFDMPSESKFMGTFPEKLRALAKMEYNRLSRTAKDLSRGLRILSDIEKELIADDMHSDLANETDLYSLNFSDPKYNRMFAELDRIIKGVKSDFYSFVDTNGIMCELWDDCPQIPQREATWIRVHLSKYDRIGNESLATLTSLIYAMAKVHDELEETYYTALF